MNIPLLASGCSSPPWLARTSLRHPGDPHHPTSPLPGPPPLAHRDGVGAQQPPTALRHNARDATQVLALLGITSP
jgi:hypothetical protein